MGYDNNTKTIALTVRNIPRSLVSAMNMRSQRLNQTREQMLRELLQREFAEDEKVILELWKRLSNEIQGSLSLNGVQFDRFTDRNEAEKLCRELAKEVKTHLVFYEGFWYCPFDSLIHLFGELKLPNCIVATYEKGANGEIIEYQRP